MGDSRGWALRQPPAELARQWRAAGWWDDTGLGVLLSDRLSAQPGQQACFRSAVRPWSGTFGDLLDGARRAAGGLRRAGVRAGDVVAFQLPNWMEAATTFYGAALLGAAVAPVVHFYGSHEVGHVLRETGARWFVTFERFGSLSGTATLQACGELPALERVWVAETSYAELLAADPVTELAAIDPAWPALVAYTSGTTAAPKGVVHTHRSIVSESRQLAATQPVRGQGIAGSLIGAPVGHAIGMLGALLMPVLNGEPVQLIDVWEPGAALRAMLDGRLAGGSGSTYFLTSLLDHPDLTPEHLELMHHVGLGGSAVPRAVTDRATALGLRVVRAYGSTEHPSVTGSAYDDPAEKRLGTDGRPLPGVELRLAADGEIVTRGPDRFAGYVDSSLTDEVLDADGWYQSGDIGVVDADGYLTVTDRKKDIIIRGGENISAAEVEEQLLRLDGVAGVAVVAAPDARLGEHAAAFLVLRDPTGAAPTLEDVTSHLAAAGLAKQKWPEEMLVVAELPRTASGKIRKAELRERLRERA